MKALVVGAVCLGLVGCSLSPVKPMYVSPTQYQGWGCEQLRLEYNRIGQYLKSGIEVPKQQTFGVGFGLGGVIGGRHGGGIVPSVSVNMGQYQNSARTEYAKVLGQREAVAQAAEFKNCPFKLPKYAELQPTK